MLSRILFATIAVFAVVAAADHEFGVFEVTTVSPTNAHFRGRDLITIKGVGFRTFSQVACLWNHEWSSFDSRIVDDNTIVCETPVLDYSEITALPFTTTLNVVFDGDSSINHLVTENFVFGPALVSFSPASGFVGGGEKFTVKGARFSDFKSAAIYFDGKACLSTIIRNDTDIICVVPAGSYDQDAMVTVVFDGQQKTYLHFENTYHFGPVITTIVPPCGNFQGGSRVSLLGNNFADPVLGSTVPPVGALPTVEVVFNSRRYFGLDVTFDGSQVIFTTPFIDDNTFGQDVDIYVHFKGINSKVTLAASTFKFRYGPIVYNTAFPTPYLVDPSSFKNPSPSSGHRAGGDIIAIDGCGFSNFTTAQISPILDVSPNPREFCIRGPNGAGGAQDTLVVTSCGIGCERILCYSAPFDCEPADIANGLSVEFRAPSDRFQTSYVLPPAEEDPLSFKLGPVVTSIDKSRGRWTGGETVTVTGVNFFSNGLVSSAADPGWTVTAVFADANDIQDPVTVTVTVVSDTKMTFVTPQMPFNYNALLNFNFDSTCESLPRIPFAFTFGPSCSTLTPPNDILSGGRPVTISGLGFTEDGVSNLSNVEVRLCNLRLSDASACDVFEVPQVTSVSNTAITFVTSSLRDGISTTVGGNRLFGDAFEVQVLFNGVGAVIDEEDAFGLLSCDIFRFGPVTSAISPQKGPTGPRAANSPGTKVTITGTAFNDPVYNQNIRVAINSGSNGYIFNNAAKVDGFNDQTKDRRITFSTVWGGVANTDADVITVFNTCNTTVSDFTVNWGPVITSVSGIDGAPINPIGNANLDIYGALPEGGQQIVVNGLGFDDFPGEDGELAIRCLIDGVQVSTSVNEDGTQVTCTLPPRSFSTVVNVTLEFGYICGDSALPFNYLQSLTATQRVFYSPRIISISPDYGLTSGGQQVTFTGEGFNGWDTYVCYFGQYSNLQVATVNDEGTTVTCSTPHHRAEFNTDVSAHILLSGIHPSRKVISPVTYHYGPICSEVLPSVASIAGGNAANINGDGFIDCQDSGPDSPFLNCTFVDVQIAFNYTLNKNNSAVFANNTGLTSTTVGFFAPAAVDGCGERPVVSLYFPDAIVSDESRRYVQCTNDDEAIYHYGPLVSGYSSQFFRANTAYGWTDTQVTITGLSLADPSLGQPTCQFGNTTGTTVSVTDESVICAAPENKWDVVVEVSLNYGNSCKIQDTVAGLFHYGPVIDSISPDFGYVAGETPVTFSGFAFECCGITQYECMFPGNLTDNFSYPTTFVGNTVTCNVPANERIDVLFNNVGVRFGGSFFTGNDSYHTLTEDNEVLRYYYGPIVTGITPDRASLSGEGDAITILGAGFDDPYFDGDVVCDFFTKTNGFNGTTTASSVDFDSIVCPVPTFNHRCGDFDDIRPRWGRSLSLQQLRPEQGASYWKTALPARSAARPVLPFSSDGGSTRAQFYGPVIYGPTILSVQSVDGLVDPISESASAIRAPISGGVFVSVTFDDIQDWADAGSDNSFGSEFAWCLFGNRGSPALSAITPGSNTITCEIPSGAWNFKGQLSVILDPHADSGTTLTTDDDQYWHWLPFATNVNKNLAGPKGYESIVVTGAGFCQYNSVICTFGNTQGVQADIVNDYRVVCQSPPASPGLAPLTLTFCSGLDCSAVTDNALNTIPVLETFTIAGITNISPREGPRCGGTNLTISGAGFSLFERLTCRFNQGRFESAATLLSDGSAYCITPDTTSEAVSNPVSCVDVALVGRFKDTADIVFESPVTFEIGTPIVFASDPTSAWIEVKTEVVVIGEYFNGDALNIQEGKYKCVFGDLDPIPAEFYYFTEDDNELKTAIVCDTPTIFSEPDLKTGTVDLEIIFACNDAKATVNKLPFTFFQKPDIDDFTPKEGAEVGGTQVVVTGEHLAGGSGYFCSFGTFGIDNQVVSAVWDPVEATITCVSPSNVVSTNVLVDFAISVDGGKTFVRAEEPYQYEDVTRVCGDNDAPGDNPNVPLIPINSSSVLAPSFLLALLAVAFSRLFLF